MTCIFVFCFCSCSQQLKIFESRNQLQEKNLPAKYSRENILDPTTARDPRNLTHSLRNELFCLKEIFLKNGYPEDFTSKYYKKFMDNIHVKVTTVTVEKNLHEKIY